MAVAKTIVRKRMSVNQEIAKLQAGKTQSRKVSKLVYNYANCKKQKK